MLKALDLWLPAYFSHRAPSTPPTDVLICVCDHFEPFHCTNKRVAMRRVERWQREFPKIATAFRDSGGHAPRHTFFYPIEQYDPDILGQIASLCHATDCELEVHLHHHADTPENLRARLEEGKSRLANHGLLARDDTGAVRYGFIHGNWALDNSHPEGINCGVNNELQILGQTGCYADFTLPSAPNRTQTRTINSIYYATDSPGPKSHDTGRLAAVGQLPSGDLLLVQGPLALNLRWRKFGVLPRIENADLTASNPPTADRLRLWRELGIHVQGRPEWIFVKLHTHGASPPNSAALLGEPMRRFHRSLAELEGLRFHYVSAREMVNIIHAAEAGHSGNPADYRDFRYRRERFQ